MPITPDFPEDKDHENGNYQNICLYCETNFMGHKRRVVCRICRMKEDLKDICHSLKELYLGGANPETSNLGEPITKLKEIIDSLK